MWLLCAVTVVASWFTTATHAAQGLKVIGAGWPPGTSTLSAALDKLHVRSCGTMESILASPTSYWKWMAITNADEDDVLRRQLLKAWVEEQQLDCTLGFPASLYYEDLMELYPRALVLLSESDSNDAWWAEASKTILRFGEMDEVRRVGLGVFHFMHFNPLGVYVKVLLKRTYLNLFVDMGVRHEYMSKDLYRSWMETVRTTVPKQRLLTYNVNQGWQPLCRALGVPEPSERFPVHNETLEFARKWDAVAALGWVTVALYLCVCFVVLRWACRSPGPTERAKQD